MEAGFSSDVDNHQQDYTMSQVRKPHPENKLGYMKHGQSLPYFICCLLHDAIGSLGQQRRMVG
jgi:hypothetical protein